MSLGPSIKGAVIQRLVEDANALLARLHRPDAPQVRSERRSPEHIVFTSDFSGIFGPRK